MLELVHDLAKAGVSEGAAEDGGSVGYLVGCGVLERVSIRYPF